MNTPRNPVTFEWYEFANAAQAGLMRSVHSILTDYKEFPPGPDNDEWLPMTGRMLEGNVSERIVAKYLGTYDSCSSGTYTRHPDIGEWDVRHTVIPTGCLIIRPTDNPDRDTVLVTGTGPKFWVPGWLHNRDAPDLVKPKNPGSRGEAWFVPQTLLRPMSELEYRA